MNSPFLLVTHENLIRAIIQYIYKKGLLLEEILDMNEELDKSASSH
jgi:hypothetical protein